MPIGYRDSHIIQKAIKNNNGDTIGYSLENGEIIMKEEAVSLAAQGYISGILEEHGDIRNEFK